MNGLITTDDIENAPFVVEMEDRLRGIALKNLEAAMALQCVHRPGDLRHAGL